MSEQCLALVPGPLHHVLAAGSGTSSLPEMGVLRDTPRGLHASCSLPHLGPCGPFSNPKNTAVKVEGTEGNLDGFLRRQ